MRVVHVGEYVSGGVATYLRTLVGEQINNPSIDQITIFLSATNSETLEFNSSKVHVIPYEYHRGVAGILQLMSVWINVKEMHPDVVHLHSTFAGLLRLRNLVRKSNFRVIYCAHGWAFTRDSGKIKNRVFAGIERFLAHGCNAIINISPSEQKAAQGYNIPLNKMVMINNAITIPRKLPQKRKLTGRLKVLFVGRFDRQKGVDVLLSAARQLENIDFRLAGRAVVGGFDLKEIKMSDNVELLGWLNPEQVSQQMLNADAVIIPSRWEGFGLVALEAMKNQCAVLAADVGGLVDVVNSEKFGMRFEPGSESAIIATLKSVDRQSLENMGRNGQANVVATYNAKTMESDVYKIYLD